MIWFIVIYGSNEKKALALAAKVQSNTLQDYNYYKSLDKKHQKTMKKDMASQPYYYSMIAKSIAMPIRETVKRKRFKISSECTKTS
jgi:hypothetical protein